MKTVHVHYKDNAGNVSATYWDQIGLDTTAPTGAISINGGAASTNTPSVTLTLSASDGSGSGVYQMRFSNDGSAWSAWEAYGTSKAWTLTSGAGTKTVYVQYKDNAGNISGSFSDTIILEEPVYPTEGTIGTQITIRGSGFGLKKGKVLIGSAALKVVSWADASIVATISKTLPVDVYDVTITSKVKGAPPIVHRASFSVMPPQIDLIDPKSGNYEDVVKVTGKYFGTKAGQVFLSYVENNVRTEHSCRLDKKLWKMTDPVSGESEATFSVPCGLGKAMLDLKIQNTTGSSVDYGAFENTEAGPDCPVVEIPCNDPYCHDGHW
jgi:hypothetical protein